MDPLTFRPPSVAGMFYPAQRTKLSHDLDQMFEAVSVLKPQGTLIALIAPHAGYQYSGMTAAYAYSLLKNHQFASVVIVSPSHKEYFDGISVFSGSGYLTPLGELRIDQTLRNALLKDEALIVSSTRGHGAEHAVEVHLPFLQKIGGDIRILPIVMGDQRREYCFHLGEKLASILDGRNVLIVASSDLSHYHTYHEAERLDRVFIDDVKAFETEQLMDHLEDETTEACGGGPTVAVMTAARLLGANNVQILHQCNSGDVTGDHSQVVGYCSAAFFRTN